MAKYIDRESIYKTLAMENPFGWNNDDLAELFRQAKPVDVAPVVHGRWIPFHSEAAGYIQYCSACEIGFDAKMDYCPHCGAKMDIKDGGDNDAESIN